MIGKKTSALALSAALLGSASVAQAPSATVNDTVRVAPTASIVRAISLRELGYAQGIELAGLSGSTELFFPLPTASGVESMRLVLPYRSASSFESRRSVSLEVGGRTQYTMALPVDYSEGVIDIPIDPSLIKQGFLTVRIVYSGAISDDRCVDQRVSGAYFSVGAGAGLQADLSAGALSKISSVAAFMPSAVEVSLPYGANEAETAAALTLMLGNPYARIQGIGALPADVIDGWSVSRVAFAGSKSPALSMQMVSGEPQVVIGGDDPAASARLLRSRWRALAASGSVKAATRTVAANKATLTIADIGADTSIRDISDRGKWDVAIPASAIPAGYRMSGLVVDAAVSEDGGPSRPIISVLFNGLLLGSAEADEDGRTRMNLDFPKGVLTTRNNLEVSVIRQTAAGECKYAPQGYPAQLLPSSAMKLEQIDEISDFSDLPSTFNDGFTVVMPDASYLGSVAALLNPLAASEGKVQVSFSGIPDEGDYVFVGPEAPAGSDPIVSFDQGRVEIDGEHGETLIDSSAINNLTTVQILEQGGRTVLWVRPGENFSSLAASASAPLLGYGDVAFLSGDQLTFAFNSERDRLIDIAYPEHGSFAQFLSKYRLWLIAFGWIIASIGFVYLLRRVMASNKTAD